MILPWPLTSSMEIAQMLRPGGTLRPDSALRSLRDKDLAAAPINVVPRSRRGADGRVVWYSSLMLDVARLVRTGDLDAAADAHVASIQLAGHRAAGFVAQALSEHGEPEPNLAEIDMATGGALTRLAMLTASALARLSSKARIERHVGRVASVSDQVAVVVDADGHSLSVPVPIRHSSTTWVDARVSIDIEALPGGAATLWVRPAFDPADDPHERVTGGPHLLTDAERRRLSGPVVAHS